MQLKLYQSEALRWLEVYLQRVRETGNANTAFYELSLEIWGRGVPYQPVEFLGGLPYVCLRVPTGGGKTLLAAHSIAVIADFLERSHPIVLWLVPSNQIEEQTLAALRNTAHPYRVALEAKLGAVTVMDTAQALSLQPSDVQSSAVVIVATIQAFRVDDTSGRKVYEGNGHLMAHFQGLNGSQLERLERFENGAPVTSLANVLRLHNPAVIVDEAHNTRTPLSFKTLERISPSCILEFTATPAPESNVLYSVSAQQLKGEDMIKLPVLLEVRSEWRDLLHRAIGQRLRLEALAREEEASGGAYLRPILLLQAEANRSSGEPVTVEVVKAFLLEAGISEDQIAIATGDVKELYGVDLASQSCQIRFIITVQALREGWDCPFAYVLATVMELRSSVAAEQLVGRVLRMPNAKRKAHPELNRAYVFSTSKFLPTVLRNLQDSLVASGFDKQEASQLVRVANSSRGAGQTSLFDTPFTGIAPLEPISLGTLPAELQAKLSIDLDSGEVVAIVPLEASEREAVQRLIVQATPPAISGQSAQATLTRAVLREPFSVPRLVIRQDDLWEPLEKAHFLEREWSLRGKDAALTETDFPSKVDAGSVAELDYLDGHLRISAPQLLAQQSRLLEAWGKVSSTDLVYWLDTKISHPDLTPEDAQIFMTRVVTHLIRDRGLTLEFLIQEKFRLRPSVEAKIEMHRRAAVLSAYKGLFDDDPTLVTVRGDAASAFHFKPGDRHYPCNTRYDGPQAFNKHYYNMIAAMNGEESACAGVLDAHVNVKHWVRNLERDPLHAFWLQTSSDKFYPDFVALLHDGRVMVVEHKGGDRITNDDSKEKNTLGELWARRSDSAGMFLMTTGRDFAALTVQLDSSR